LPEIEDDAGVKISIFAVYYNPKSKVTLVEVKI